MSHASLLESLEVSDFWTTPCRRISLTNCRCRYNIIYIVHAYTCIHVCTFYVYMMYMHMYVHVHQIHPKFLGVNFCQLLIKECYNAFVHVHAHAISVFHIVHVPSAAWLGVGVYPDSLLVVVADESHGEETTTSLSNLEYINPRYRRCVCCTALMRPN